MPKVSVCLPNFNKEKYIGRALKSVLGQTFRDIEVIVVDNASTDRSLEVVRGIADDRVVVHRNPENLGYVRNLNRCLELAKGDHIAMLNTDDLWLPHFLERMVRSLDSMPEAGFAFCPSLQYDEGKRKASLHRPYHSDHYSAPGQEFEKLLHSCYIWTPSVLVRREAYSRVGQYNASLRYACDWEMWLRISSVFGVAYVNEPLAVYTTNEQNLSKEGIKKNEMVQDITALFDSVESHLKMSGKEALLPPALKRRCIALELFRQADNALRHGYPARCREALDSARSYERSILFDPRVLLRYTLSYLPFAGSSLDLLDSIGRPQKEFSLPSGFAGDS